MGVRLVKHVEALYCPPNGQTNDIRLFRDLQTIDIDELMQFAHSSEGWHGYPDQTGDFEHGFRAKYGYWPTKEQVDQESAGGMSVATTEATRASTPQEEMSNGGWESKAVLAAIGGKSSTLFPGYTDQEPGL